MTSIFIGFDTAAVSINEHRRDTAAVPINEHRRDTAAVPINEHAAIS